MGKRRPDGIDSFKEIQYLDYERKWLDIPPNSITPGMLSEGLRGLSGLPIGYYYQAVVGLTSQGKPVFDFGSCHGSRYGMCVYAPAYCVYGVGEYGECEYI